MTYLRSLLAVLIGSLIASPAWAEPPDGPPGKQLERFNKMRGKLLRKKVGLSEAKAAKVEAVFKTFAPLRKKLRKTVRGARKDLRQLFKSDSDDQAAYRVALTKLRNANKAMQQLNDKQYGQVEKILTPKEQAKLLRAMQRVRRKMAKMHERKRGQKRNKSKRQGRQRPKHGPEKKHRQGGGGQSDDG